MPVVAAAKITLLRSAAGFAVRSFRGFASGASSVGEGPMEKENNASSPSQSLDALVKEYLSKVNPEMPWPCAAPVPSEDITKAPQAILEKPRVAHDCDEDGECGDVDLLGGVLKLSQLSKMPNSGHIRGKRIGFEKKRWHFKEQEQSGNLRKIVARIVEHERDAFSPYATQGKHPSSIENTDFD